MLFRFCVVVHNPERSVHIRNGIFERRIGNFSALDVFGFYDASDVYAVFIHFEKKVFRDKLFDGVIGRKKKVVVGVIALDDGEYFFYRVESGGGDDFNLFARFFGVPTLELGKNSLVDIFAGNVHFKLLGAIAAPGEKNERHCRYEYQKHCDKFFHFLLLLFFCGHAAVCAFLRLLRFTTFTIISTASTVTKSMVLSARIAGSRLRRILAYT